MILLLDIGNTHTHLGLASNQRLNRLAQLPTASWFDGTAPSRLVKFVGRTRIEAAMVCSVVPRATPLARQFIQQRWKGECRELTHKTAGGLKIDYPHPETIGPDRLANVIALKHHFGAPAVAVDFGTAITLDVVDRTGSYVGGIIAPGLALMTRYLGEQTALLPRIQVREVRSVIGKSTTEAMLIGTVQGCRGLVRQLIADLKRELHCPRLRVVATGGDARLIAARLPEITAVEPRLTLEGLRLAWEGYQKRDA